VSYFRRNFQGKAVENKSLHVLPEAYIA